MPIRVNSWMKNPRDTRDPWIKNIRVNLRYFVDKKIRVNP